MKSGKSELSVSQLLESLARLPLPEKYWVGFSGGADSTALLQALFECRGKLSAPIHAIHFHHGLQDQADSWMKHCGSFCRQRDIPYSARQLNIESAGGRSLEEESRNARYIAVSEILGKNEMYLTAHHAEDQAETLFLNLMRGSGIEGLAGIPALRSLGHGWVARPLLDISRQDLEQFLQQRDIEWLEDPSNKDTSFDRNFLRQDLFPQLDARWPGLAGRLSRTARNARISANAMANFIESQSGDLIHDPLKMPLSKLLELEVEMQTLILRQWLRRHEVPMLPEARLREFLKQISEYAVTGRAEVKWQEWMIKQYGYDLWLHRREAYKACPSLTWDEGMAVELGQDSGRLCLDGSPVDIPPAWAVRARRPGDRIRPLPNRPSRKIKHFFQSAAVPPWLRAGIPVLEWDNEPVALGDWALSHRLRQWLVENDVELSWQPADPVLSRIRDDCQQRDEE